MRFYIESKFNKKDIVYSTCLIGAGTIKDIRFSHFGSVFRIEYLVEDSNASRIWLEENTLSERGW
ncbi:MAG: hypothetical protein J6F30_17235 [Cellulosilyticum sp.]|nr:hypothetical protein [Cellulosilyticum sp.]